MTRVPSCPSASISTEIALPGVCLPRMPAMNVRSCPAPIRMVSSSSAAPNVPMKMLSEPATLLTPAP
jgi:hypothetical protein